MRSRALRSKSDEELVREFQAGAERSAAILELFERHGQLTYAFLRRRTGTPEVARELNQDLYLAVLESLDRFRGESSFKTWLFRLAHHRLSNLRRRWRTHLDELPSATPDDLAHLLAASDEQRPDAQFATRDRVGVLRGCIAALDEVERAVVIGQYYEGVTLEELTRRLGLTNKSGARASLLSAQRKLKRCIERAGVSARD
jgi:RNA polymerase sigma-70 factor (ECF subfamily)